MHYSIAKRMLACALPLVLVACGGGGGGSTPTTAGIEGSGAPVAVSKSIISIGAITAFGSIFVNGAEYSLTGSTIQVDGRTAAESDLKLGQVVTVVANQAAAGSTVRVAKSVAANIAVAGRVSAVDLASNRLTILGQRIEIDAATQIVGALESQPLGGLGVGSDIEVTGFADSSGVLFARSIQPRRVATPLRITGRAINVDDANRRLQIGSQLVSYGSATLNGFSGHALEGAIVQVSANQVAPNGELLAIEMSYVDLRFPGTVGDTAELQGWVTRYASSRDFDVDGHPVTTTSGTVMLGPLAQTLSLVQLDAFIQVKGRVINDGVVEASQITTANSINIGSVIQSVSESSLLAPMWRRSLCDLSDPAYSVDSVPVSRQGIRPGDRATIYGYSDFLVTQQKCFVVDVEHAVVGRVESLDTASASLMVNGQRVWLTPGTAFLGNPSSSASTAGLSSAGEARAALHPGDLVAVSGDLTAEGQIVASSIARATQTQGFRVTGFARDVDTVHQQLRLGSLEVDYSGASMSGFNAGGPATGDRITMIATTEPASGIQIAAAMKYAGGPVRGEKNNLVTINGLLTSFSGSDYSIEGRLTVPIPTPATPANGLERVICDPAKLHENLHTMLVTIVGPTDERPMRLFHVCPAGRRNDAYEVLPAIAPTLYTAVTARVQAVDPARYTLHIAGTSVGLSPASLLTLAQSSGGLIHTTPLRLSDLHVGDRVRIGLPASTGDLPLVDSVWAGPAVDSGQDSVEGFVQSASQPDLAVSNLTIHTAPGTAITYTYLDSLCNEVIGAAADLWRNTADINTGKDAPYRITATGTFSGSTLVASRVSVTSSKVCDGGDF